MPFASEKQRRYLWVHHPDVAQKFADLETKRNHPMAKLPAHHRKRVNSHHRLAKLQERKAEAKARAHKKEKERLEKAIARIERRFEPRIEKLHREIKEHEHRAQEHSKEAHRIEKEHAK